MDIIEITPENLFSSHICCALSNAPDQIACANAKKRWMEGVFPDGYHFWRLDARGKAFIEVIPAEKAWCPLDAPGWLFIDCFWVSGQFKGHGHAGALFEKALTHARQNNFHGLLAVSTTKKSPFLSDPGFYRHQGFVVADDAPPNYLLFSLPLSADVTTPKFKTCVKHPSVTEPGVVIYYSDHCPHTARYIFSIQSIANKHDIPFYGFKMENSETAQNAPNPFPTYAMFYNGKFVTNEIFSEGKFRKFLNIE